jgi:release factor glutamine methyltransferase
MHQTENKIKFINIDIDKFNFKKYDFIISNPPYIDNIKLKRLEENVRLFEPKVALKAGFDGLTEIKKLIIKSKNLLKINGILIFEIGVKQETYIKEFLIKNCFYINKILKDINSIPRVIISTKV